MRNGAPAERRTQHRGLFACESGKVWKVILSLALVQHRKDPSLCSRRAQSPPRPVSIASSTTFRLGRARRLKIAHHTTAQAVQLHLCRLTHHLRVTDRHCSIHVPGIWRWGSAVSACFCGHLFFWWTSSRVENRRNGNHM